MTDDLRRRPERLAGSRSDTGISAWRGILHQPLGRNTRAGSCIMQSMSDVEDRESRPRGVYWLPNLLTTGHCSRASTPSWLRSIGASTTRASPCSLPCFSTAWTAASPAGRIPRAPSARNTTVFPTWCPSGWPRHRDLSVGRGARIAEYGPLWRRLGWLVCFFYAAAAGLRLARFNSRSAGQDKHYFEGLPSPSAAAIVAA